MAGYIPIGGIPHNNVHTDPTNSGVNPIAKLWNWLTSPHALFGNMGDLIGDHSVQPPAPQPAQAPVYGNQQGFQDNSTQQILQQLQSLQDPSRYMMDQASLERQARAAASAQYDPVIAALRNQAAAASARGERNQRDVISMFNQLSDSLHGDLPAIQQNYDQTQQATGKEYADLQKSIQDQYASSQADQEALYKRLSIEAAAPDILPSQMRDRDYFVNQAKTNAQTQQAALTQERQGAIDYTNRGSQMARTEGTQRGADIMAALTELLNQYNAQIGANEAAKAQAYTAGLGSLQQQNQQNALQRAQNDFQNYIASVNLGRGLRSDALNEFLKMNGSGNAVKSITDIPARVMSMGLPQTSAQNIQNVFTSSLSNDLISGGLDPNTGQQATPEAKVAQIMEQGRAQGLNAAELQALQAAALEYFGRR